MKFRDLHPNVRLRVAETFFSDTISGMIFPFMAIYFAQNLGAGLTGLLLTINISIGIVASFYGGYISDKIGRKKLWAYSEITRFLAVAIMAAVNSPLIQSDQLAALVTIGMLLISNICMGFSGPAASAMLIDVSTPDNRNFMYSVTFWSNNLAAAMGSLLGGFLFKDYLFELFAFLAVAHLVSAMIVTFFITETYVPVKGKSVQKISVAKDIIQKYTVVLKDRLFLLFTVAYLLIVSLEFQLPNYIAIKLSENMEPQSILPFLEIEIDGINALGILRAENTIIIVVFMFFINRLISKFKNKHVWLTGFTLFSIGYVAISISNNASVLILFMLIASIGELMYYAPHKSYLAALPPDHLRSSYIAVNDLVIRLSYLIAYLSISMSAFLPPLVMTGIFTLMAVSGMMIFIKILPSLETKNEMARNHIA